jgi:hypothetical protein
MGISETNFRDPATWDIRTTASTLKDVSHAVLNSTGQRITRRTPLPA